jgi:hypothetical protein
LEQTAILNEPPSGSLRGYTASLLCAKRNFLMNYPAASCEVSAECDLNYPKGVPPNVFIGSPVPPGFPLKECGNDGLRKENSLTQQGAGNRSAGIEGLIREKIPY